MTEGNGVVSTGKGCGSQRPEEERQHVISSKRRNNITDLRCPRMRSAPPPATCTAEPLYLPLNVDGFPLECIHYDETALRFLRLHPCSSLVTTAMEYIQQPRGPTLTRPQVGALAESFTWAHALSPCQGARCTSEVLLTSPNWATYLLSAAK